VALQNSYFIVIELIIYTVSCTQKTHRQTARCWCRKKKQYTKTSRGVSSLNLFGFDFVMLFTIICLLCCKLNKWYFLRQQHNRWKLDIWQRTNNM
jgi:hypothetical protein